MKDKVTVKLLCKQERNLTNLSYFNFLVVTVVQVSNLSHSYWLIKNTLHIVPLSVGSNESLWSIHLAKFLADKAGPGLEPEPEPARSCILRFSGHTFDQNPLYLYVLNGHPYFESSSAISHTSHRAQFKKRLELDVILCRRHFTFYS